jgi:hypothetical protein
MQFKLLNCPVSNRPNDRQEVHPKASGAIFGGALSHRRVTAVSDAPLGLASVHWDAAEVVVEVAGAPCCETCSASNTVPIGVPWPE